MSELPNYVDLLKDQFSGIHSEAAREINIDNFEAMKEYITNDQIHLDELVSRLQFEEMSSDFHDFVTIYLAISFDDAKRLFEEYCIFLILHVCTNE